MPAYHHLIVHTHGDDELDAGFPEPAAAMAIGQCQCARHRLRRQAPREHVRADELQPAHVVPVGGDEQVAGELSPVVLVGVEVVHGGERVGVDEAEKDLEHGGLHVADLDGAAGVVAHRAEQLGGEDGGAHGEHHPVRGELHSPHVERDVGVGLEVEDRPRCAARSGGGTSAPSAARRRTPRLPDDAHGAVDGEAVAADVVGLERLYRLHLDAVHGGGGGAEYGVERPRRGERRVHGQRPAGVGADEAEVEGGGGGGAVGQELDVDGGVVVVGVRGAARVEDDGPVVAADGEGGRPDVLAGGEERPQAAVPADREPVVALHRPHRARRHGAPRRRRRRRLFSGVMAGRRRGGHHHH